jgi:hypothetical protein
MEIVIVRKDSHYVSYKFLRTDPLYFFFFNFYISIINQVETPTDSLYPESLLEKVETPTDFRDEIYFFSNRDGIRDRKSS